VTALTVRPCEEVKPGDLLGRLDTTAGALEIRSNAEGRVMEFLVQVGDRIRPGTEVMSVAKSDGPAVMTIAVPENGELKEIHLHRILRAIEHANAKEPPPGMSPWRLPIQAELNEISEDAGGGNYGLRFLGSGMAVRNFAPGIFMGLQGQKLWCRKEAAEGQAISLEQLGVVNGHESGDAVLLLCRNPLATGSAS
jgi:hypothetical protein